MSLSFEAGDYFAGDHRHTSGVFNRKLTSNRVRRALTESSKHLNGEAILSPSIETMAALLGVAKPTLAAKYAGTNGRNGYEELVHIATGLSVMKSPGLVLYDDKTEIKPLSEHSGSMPITEEEITEVTEQIETLAENLPSEARKTIGENLINS